ncbi:MAG: cyclic nucleotide-binding domain-containing protein, partial [Acidimicrobiia bacterium]
GHTLMHGSLPADIKATAHLRPVDRALLLQSTPLLSHATAAQLWRLSATASERNVSEGKEAIGKHGVPATLVVVSGMLSVDGPNQQGTAAAGDVIGMYETLAGTPINATVTATADSTVLRIDRGGLFDVLADRTDLLQGIFSTLLRSADARSGNAISNTVSTP